MMALISSGSVTCWPSMADNQVAAQHDGSIADVGLLVAAAQAGPLGRAAGNHLLDQNAGIDGQTHLRGQIGADARKRRCPAKAA